MRKLSDLIQRAAPTEATVLITGETGTGSACGRTRPSCPSIVAQFPKSSWKASFSASPGVAFTGALSPRLGLFQGAKEGTLLFVTEARSAAAGLPHVSIPRGKREE